MKVKINENKLGTLLEKTIKKVLKESEGEILVMRANQKLTEARDILDTAMYSSQDLTKEQFESVRKMYDLICEAQDCI